MNRPARRVATRAMQNETESFHDYCGDSDTILSQIRDMTEQQDIQQFRNFDYRMICKHTGFRLNRVDKIYIISVSIHRMQSDALQPVFACVTWS